MNQKYGPGTVSLTITDSYSNMLEIIEKHPYVVEIAKKAIYYRNFYCFYGDVMWEVSASASKSSEQLQKGFEGKAYPTVSC